MSVKAYRVGPIGVELPAAWVTGRSPGLIVFGLYIVISSAAAIILGLWAEDGWLAIAYGALGISMGAAGVIGGLTKGMLRAGLLGWFLIGIASRAILEGGLFLLLFSAAIAVGLGLVLFFELKEIGSRRAYAAAVICGALALSSIPVLALVAPHFPLLCQPLGTPGFGYNYPPNEPPFADIEVGFGGYHERCLAYPPAH